MTWNQIFSFSFICFSNKQHNKKKQKKLNYFRAVDGDEEDKSLFSLGYKNRARNLKKSAEVIKVASSLEVFNEIFVSDSTERNSAER